MFSQGESVGSEGVLQLAIFSIDLRPRRGPARVGGAGEFVQVIWEGNRL